METVVIDRHEVQSYARLVGVILFICVLLSVRIVALFIIFAFVTKNQGERLKSSHNFNCIFFERFHCVNKPLLLLEIEELYKALGFIERRFGQV